MGALDVRLFHWLNGAAHAPWLDQAMPVITRAGTWVPILLLLLIYLLVFRGRRGRVAALTLIVAVALSDVTASQLLKPAFGRPRPCQTDRETRLLIRCGGRNGFPSNHASNASAVATVLGAFYPASLWAAVPAALLVGYSRVYVGVHYPGDVVAGLVYGTGLGLACGAFSRRRFLRSAGPPGKSSRRESP